MKEEIKFKLGDRVYAPFHGYGVVTAIHEDACVYPIEVTWDDSGLKNMEDASTFTADGLLSKYYANTDTILTVVKGSHKRNRRKEMSASKFKVGDRVYNPSHGYGVVTEIKDDEQEYPIVVTWEEKQHGCISIFTPEGFAVKGLNSEDDDLTLVEKASLKGEKEMEEDSKFQVGDRVYAPFHKYGTIVEIVDTDASYPITVRWDESRYKPGVDLSTFTEDGYLFFGDKTENTKITKIEGEKMGQISGVIDHNDESTIERMEDALSKKVEDAVNPVHYKVEGLPEAYDIMTHLMNREQLEGFLWGEYH